MDEQNDDKENTVPQLNNEGLANLVMRENMAWNRPGRTPTVGADTAYDFLEGDRRTFFLGAPSNYSDKFPAHQLRNIRRRARKIGDYTAHFCPEGVACVKKTERAVLPDGTTYSIATTWVPEPIFDVLIPHTK